MFVLERFNFCNDVKLPNDSGSSPKFRQSLSERNSSRISSPMEIGSPTIGVPDRFRNDRCFALPIESGKLVILEDDISNLDNDTNFPIECGSFSI
ncbi:hypothetical protein EUGRSUZ_E03541 [Eucalyptus grandis]|uniref:Uncharacterized protein n=2 Tax=Eucalyptus grandis TaxID=71139 RepID=A0ACC3LDB1_EUCGR|nr:hypothetical protein EUGRSUZ_E03541 [Eucalyptus grandis]